MLRAETPAQQLRKSHPAIQGDMTYIRNHRRPAWGEGLMGSLGRGVTLTEAFKPRLFKTKLFILLSWPV